MNALIIPRPPGRRPRPLDPRNVIGYCRLHGMAVSRSLNRKRKCVDKGCVHFRKNHAHPRWQRGISEEARP